MKRLRLNLNRSPVVIRHQGRTVAQIHQKSGGTVAETAKPAAATSKPPQQNPKEVVRKAHPQPQKTNASSPDRSAAPTETDVNRLHELLGTVSESVSELQQQHRNSLEEMQQVSVELSVSAASWLTGVAIDAGQFAVDDLIRMALHRLGADQPVQVRLNPADHQLLRELMSASPVKEQLEQMNCMDDPSLPRGSCRVDSGRRMLVSDMESRLEEIRKLWMENLDAAQIERRGDGSHGRTLRRFPDRRETA